MEFFIDPVLRGPTIGCMLMCFVAALVGVVVVLRKQSLVGESLSHAAYPGVIAGVVVASFFVTDTNQGTLVALLILGGAFISSLLGLYAIHFLEQQFRTRSDSALCFVLASFFGIGVTMASRVQFTHTTLYQQIQGYLYGQAATMTDWHIFLYAALSLLVLTVIISLYQELQILLFDREYARSMGIAVKGIEASLFILTVLAVVVGIRSVGIVLMSAMLIAPAVAARQYTHKLYMMFLLSSLFGLISGFFGNYFSVEGTRYLVSQYPQTRLALPTGPMIVMVASGICFFSLFFAPENGLFVRLIRIIRFQYQCLCENILKAMWRAGADRAMSLSQIAKLQNASLMYLRFILSRLANNGWIVKKGKQKYLLTRDGQIRAAQIVRFHRLWELYLADYLGMGVERVHRSAEEMEHIITPEIEMQLTTLLKNPKQDPHKQPIPSKESL